MRWLGWFGWVVCGLGGLLFFSAFWFLVGWYNILFWHFGGRFGVLVSLMVWLGMRSCGGWVVIWYFGAYGFGLVFCRFCDLVDFDL